MSNNSNNWIGFHQSRINRILVELFDSRKNKTTLHNASSYSVLNGGKRIRALLVYAVGEIAGTNIKVLDQLASSFELIHAYSLIHDDLPSMDDDNLRRGKATCHIKFNEAQAILAGDALQALAFELLSSPQLDIDSAKKITMINILSNAIGINGMVLGQSQDIESKNDGLDIDHLEKLQELKTGLLIQAACEVTYLTVKNLDIKTKELIKNIGILIGKIYQITDDILDCETNSSILGKTAGKDKKDNKATYVSLLGLNKSKEKNSLYFIELKKIVKDLPGNTTNIMVLINYIYTRTY
ncbi:polyprenyl synthetase family protein [Methylophilaceae bacterium]|nr:polyprenyl synthetase family protein [Methylophilaceae bacterium]